MICVHKASKPSHPPPATEIWLSKGLNIHFPPVRDGRRGVERDAASRPTFNGLRCQTLPELTPSRDPSSPIDGLPEQELPQCPSFPVPSSSHHSCQHEGRESKKREGAKRKITSFHSKGRFQTAFIGLYFSHSVTFQDEGRGWGRGA